MADWSAFNQFDLPIVVLHQHSGQDARCLDSLVEYSCTLSRNKHVWAFRDPDSIVNWLLSQPVKLDKGEGPSMAGCDPRQRSRIWPDDGLNCWEATAHLLAVAFAHRWPVEFHIFDAPVGKLRHVFPAIAPLWSSALPVPLVIQPPAKTSIPRPALSRAQAEWYNDLLGAVHLVGDKVLRVFGAGELADSLAELEGDELPDWARTAKQKEQRAAALIKRAAEESKKTKDKATEVYAQEGTNQAKQQTSTFPIGITVKDKERS